MDDRQKTGRVRWWWITLAAGSAALFVSALAYQSAVWGDARGDGDLLGPMQPYWAVYALSWLTLGLLLYQAAGQTWKQSGRCAVWIVLLVALTARLAVVVTTQPVLSDDIWRYIHDGATVARGGNPYVHAPGDLGPEDAPVPQVLDRINNAQMVTIYQPMSQWTFSVLDRVWSASPAWVQRWDPDHDKVFRLGFSLLDVVLVVILLWQLRWMGRSAWWAAVYGWHPLAISETAGTGHQDVLGIVLLVLALALSTRIDKDQYTARSRWFFTLAAGAAFGLAVAVKPIAAPIALALAWHLKRYQGRVVAAAGASLLAAAVVYLPFMMMDGGLTGMMDTARTFVDKWAFNGSAYVFASQWIASKPTVDTMAGILLVVILLVTAKKPGDAARSAGAFLLASLLLSSTVHPWYLLWALALLPLWFSLPMWVFSLTIAASYFAHINPEGYQVPSSIVIGEYAPVYALLAWSALLSLRRGASKTP